MAIAAVSVMKREACMPTNEEKIVAAQKAVSHLLQRMNEDEQTRYQIGFGTQSYVLLTEAAAALFDEPIEKVREHYKG